MSSGAGAELAGEPPPYEFFAALDAEERPEQGAPRVRVTARIEPDWLLELFPERVRTEARLEWHREGERVDAVEALLYDGLPLEESRGAAPDPEAAGALLAEKAQEVGLERFVDPGQLAGFEARVAFAGLAMPDRAATLRELCTGLRSFAQLREAATDFLRLLESKVDGAALRRLAPETVRLAGGRVTPVHYEAGKPPWIASRIQDFFGMRTTPRLGPAQTPVVVHLLAPSRRPVQTTTDLAGFWERLYPGVRRELMRRYPKHAWPERP